MRYADLTIGSWFSYHGNAFVKEKFCAVCGEDGRKFLFNSDAAVDCVSDVKVEVSHEMRPRPRAKGYRRAGI
jgi:hypothetical protein